MSALPGCRFSKGPAGPPKDRVVSMVEAWRAEFGAVRGTWEGNAHVHWGRSDVIIDSVTAERGLQGVQVQAGCRSMDGEVHSG